MVAVRFAVWLDPWQSLPLIFLTVNLPWLFGFRSFLVLIFAVQAAIRGLQLGEQQLPPHNLLGDPFTEYIIFKGTVIGQTDAA